MNKWQADVRDFHYGTNSYVGKSPRVPPDDISDLRIKLVEEEWLGPGELYESIVAGDLVGIADGIADMIYVLLGMAVTYGIDMEPVWNEVHATNMDKLRGPKRADGKQLKPEGWEPPDIDQIIQDQIDRHAERMFTQPINPDPATAIAKTMKQWRDHPENDD